MAKAGEKRMAICPHHSGLDERIKNNTEAIVVHDEILRKLQNRPPAWVFVAADRFKENGKWYGY